MALAEIDDPLLQRDWSAFQLACDWLDPDDVTVDAWFSAWYVVEHPGVRIDPEMFAFYMARRDVHHR